MKVHAVLSATAQALIRSQSAGALDQPAAALVHKLEQAGLKAINLPRAVRHGIVTGEVPEGQLEGLRALPEVQSVEVDGTMRAL